MTLSLVVALPVKKTLTAIKPLQEKYHFKMRIIKEYVEPTHHHDR